jgi:hypothetical protein
VISIVPSTPLNKRLITDQAPNHDLLVALSRLEAEQRESLALLQQLQEQRPTTEAASQDMLDQITIKGAESMASSALLVSGQSENDFEEAFKNFLDCWRSIPEKERFGCQLTFLNVLDQRSCIECWVVYQILFA